MKHLRPFKFEKKESSKRDKLYIFVMYAGGDADTEHPEYYELPNIKFSEYEQHLDEINSELQKYLILKDILLDDNNKYDVYDDIKNEYGEEIARMFDNAPNDPQSDFQFKCYIDRIKLVGYDKDGDRYETYI